MPHPAPEPIPDGHRPPDPPDVVFESRNVRIARIVARSWQDAATRWGSAPMEGRVCAHPLALVLDALDGEQDPAELGIHELDPAWAAIKSEAAR